MNTISPKILVALDGSEDSLNAVRYVGTVFNPDRIKVVLFHVQTEIPETFYDMENSPDFSHKLQSIRSWASEQKKVMNEFMVNARHTLVSVGFTEESVELKIQTKKSGIARDILKESHNEYQAVVVGRTGISKLKDFFIGSVATKLMGKMQHVPLIVTTNAPFSNKILIAFDGSEGAINSLSCVGSLVDTSRCEILLCHIIKALGIHQMQTSLDYFSVNEVEWLKSCETKIQPVLEDAETKLMSAGIEPNRISVKILPNQASRAIGIIDEAKSGGYNSIVVGRRGLSAVEDFISGRVSKKVFQLADDKTVWIVS